MPILRRILKYTPAVVLGLLALLWIVGQAGSLVLHLPFGGRQFVTFHAHHGRIGIVSKPTEYNLPATPQVTFARHKRFEYPERYDAMLAFALLPDRREFLVAVPIILIVLVLLPLAVGVFIVFRFPLWSWFAWTAVIAVACVYYSGHLQWVGMIRGDPYQSHSRHSAP
jgi:hypothetical protein